MPSVPQIDRWEKLYRNHRAVMNRVDLLGYGVEDYSEIQDGCRALIKTPPEDIRSEFGDLKNAGDELQEAFREGLFSSIPGSVRVFGTSYWASYCWLKSPIRLGVCCVMSNWCAGSDRGIR